MTAGAKILGVGGVFVRSPNPAALNAWSASMVGLEISTCGAATFETLPSSSTTMTAKLETEDVTPLARDDANPQERFLRILEPDGTKLELRAPPRP